MLYLWILAGIFAMLLVIALSPVKSSRRPGLEHEFDLPAAQAYDKMGRGLVFRGERYLAVAQIEKLKPEGTVLDAGCGPGYLLKEIRDRFPGLNLIGLDFNLCVIEIARKNLASKAVKLVYAPAENMPFGDCSVDMIISTGTLHHWPDTSRVLLEFFRVLKPGGAVFLMDLRRDCPRIFFWLIYAAQWFMPVPTQRTNGPRGSFWASYTIHEVKQLVSVMQFREACIKPGFGWLFVSAIK